MKLALLGVVTVALGVAFSVSGLWLAGGLWIVLGLLLRAVVTKPTDPAAPSAPLTGKAMAPGLAIMLLIGLSSLAIGIFRVGIDTDDAAWRWLPLAIGGFATSMAVLTGLLYATGSGLQAAAARTAAGRQPGTIVIRSVTETGQFINERPRLEFDLTVTLETGETYDVVKKATVPFTAIGSIKPGDTFAAMVGGPDDPTDMEIDWTSASPAASHESTATRLARLDELFRTGVIDQAEHDVQRRRILGSL